ATVLLVVALLTFSLVTATFTAIIQISVMSVLADIADENELKHGHRQEGVLYSTRALFAKIDMALGQFLAGVALDLIAFPPKAVPGQVPDDVLFKLAMIEGPLGAVPSLLASLYSSRYRSAPSRRADSRAELEARRGRVVAAPAGAPAAAGVVAPAPAEHAE